MFGFKGKKRWSFGVIGWVVFFLQIIGVGFLFLVGFKLVVSFIGRVGLGFLPCFWVWDVLGEVMLVEGVPARGVGAVGDVVCRVQELAVCGKRFVFGFELDWHCCDLVLIEWFVVVLGGGVETFFQ